MAEHASSFRSSHPLLKDRARLETIKKNMHIQIQVVLHGRRIRDDVELALPGGASVDDVLQDALLALLRTDSANVRTSWEALSSEIARNKAKDALSLATRGRRSPNAAPGTPDDVTLVPLEERLDAADPDPAHDPAEAFDRAQQQLVILRLARETLSERERLIFSTGYYRTNTDKELGEQLGITGQAVGQQFRRILRDLYAAALRDPTFPPLKESDGGEDT
ncbi:sigma-70 family RNA polymerase sigma factor [Blastococcus sp. CT_GayMR20]|uniref:sigma-70 family RNA polymerase sigma factor n=1 Tax=Blastococcus sp. CT_GayMR20 TaxID=2559609 RepID=UPI00107412F1|nr:sigma-70 family RNA polymerase sigma factor [Blastococcus sp. CT_GayMR20]TFV90106.1 sigma-70 family RNA polymerase sigma factor [Blastococcus sp. CT_GayMR20]